MPARVGRARDKAKVEAGVLLVERWILAALRNRTFFWAGLTLFAVYVAFTGRDGQTQLGTAVKLNPRRAKVDVVAITSMGGHFCARESAAISPLPTTAVVRMTVAPARGRSARGAYAPSPHRDQHQSAAEQGEDRGLVDRRGAVEHRVEAVGAAAHQYLGTRVGGLDVQSVATVVLEQVVDAGEDRMVLEAMPRLKVTCFVGNSAQRGARYVQTELLTRRIARIDMWRTSAQAMAGAAGKDRWADNVLALRAVADIIRERG